MLFRSVYGVDPRKPEPFIGISQSYDDAKLQQLISGKIAPPPEFLYYEVLYGTKTIGVLQVKPTKQRPHIITTDVGKVRKGQIHIRRGSATDGVTMNDLFEFFYGQTSGHFPMILQKLQAHAQQQTAEALYLRELRRCESSKTRYGGYNGGVPWFNGCYMVESCLQTGEPFW